MKKLYRILVDYSEVENGGAYGIQFPDIPNCFSAADNYDDILDNAREAALQHLGDLANLPAATEELADILKYIDLNTESDKQLLWVVDVDLSAIAGPAKRINVTIPEFALAKIDAAASSSGKSRSEFLTEAGLRSI